MACKPWHDGALPLSGPILLPWLLFSWFHCFWPPLSSVEPWERILSLPSGLFAPLSTCLYPLTSGLTSQKPECNVVSAISIVDDRIFSDPATCIKCCACVKECPEGARTFDTPYTAMLHKNFSVRREPELFI